MAEVDHIGNVAETGTLGRVFASLLPEGSAWERCPPERADLLVYSSQAGPRLILPAADIGLGLRYSRVWARSGSFWKWTAVRAAYRLGVLHRFPGVTAVKIRVPARPDWSHIGWDSSEEPTFAVFVREPGPYQKAVAFVGDGHRPDPRFVVKTPLGSDAGLRIEKEARLLSRLAKDETLRTHVPVLRHLDGTRMVSSQEFVRGGRTSLTLGDFHADLLGRLADTDAADAGADAARALEELLTGPSASRAAKGIGALKSALPADYTDLRGLPCVVEHGDFYPWNLFIRDGRGIVALDWEFGREVGLPLWDAVHFHLRVSRSMRRLDARTAMDQLFTDLWNDAWIGLREALAVTRPETSRYLVAVSILRFFEDVAAQEATIERLARWVRTGAWSATTTAGRPAGGRGSSSG
jgi:hypothetical protein